MFPRLADRPRGICASSEGLPTGAPLLEEALPPVFSCRGRSWDRDNNREAQVDENRRSSNQESASGDMFPVEQSMGERFSDSTPVRIPSCARAKRPDKEHVSMSEEIFCARHLELQLSGLE